MREGAEAREAGIEAQYKAKADLEMVTGLDVNNGQWTKDVCRKLLSSVLLVGRVWPSGGQVLTSRGEAIMIVV